jgi:hypothetical protein
MGCGARLCGRVWTDLPSNFEEETADAFSVERARDYLLRLPRSAADRARRYINNAPPEVYTPVRRAMLENACSAYRKPAIKLLDAQPEVFDMQTARTQAGRLFACRCRFLTCWLQRSSFN